MTAQERRWPQERRPRRPELTIVCAWCKLRQRDGDVWVPRRTTARDDELSHGICPECFRREIEKAHC